MDNPCVIPTCPEDTTGDKRWESMHRRYVAEARSSESEVLFIGDSIIQQLQFSTLWQERINSLHCLNFGIGGDRVEHVLWRALNGELDLHTVPKAVVLFVGTNNCQDCTPHEVFEGILVIIHAIRQQLGNKVQIILPTLLPRGQFPNPYRDRNDHVNTFLLDRFSDKSLPPGSPTTPTTPTEKKSVGAGVIATIDDDIRNVHVVRIHDNLIQGDQTISHHVMHDYLHLTDKGFEKTFTPVYELLCKLLDK